MGMCSNKEFKTKPNGDDNEDHTENGQLSSNSKGFQPHKFNNLSSLNQTQPKPRAVGSGTIADKITVPVTTRQVNEYDDALKLLTANAVFQDANFKAIAQSISKTPTFEALNDCVWKRSKDFMNKATTIFDNKIEAGDILQGGLGDCYYMSALSVLAERPDLIKKLFITQTYQTNGLFGVYLCHDGEFIQIALDDQFPCSIRGGDPIFSRARGPELWVLILEKAYAKIYGTYEKIEAGSSGEALVDLTGAPKEIYNIDQKSLTQPAQCWDFLNSNFQKKYLMAAGSTSAASKEAVDDKGIVHGHAYAILQVQQVVGSDGKPDKIIQMRNPWGQGEWLGDWSDNSSKWTPQLKKQFNVLQQDDGTYWINVTDFITEFRSIYISKINPDYLQNSTRLQDTPLTETQSTRVVIMKVLKKNHAFISLHQKDQRAYNKEKDIYTYSATNMTIGLIDPNTNQITTIMGQIYQIERQVNIEAVFEPGNYSITIEITWTQNIARDMVISCYGESVVSFSENKTNKVDATNIIAGIQKIQLNPSSVSNSLSLQTTPLTEALSTRVVIMKVTKQTPCVITLHQKDKLDFQQKKGVVYNYSYLRMMIGLLDPKTNLVSNNIGDVVLANREVSIESTLEPGSYAIYIEIEWNQVLARDIVISCNSDSAVSFIENKTSEGLKLIFRLVDTTKILDGLIRLQKNQTKPNLVTDFGQNNKCEYGYVMGYLYQLYTNDNLTLNFYETLNSDIFQLETVGPCMNPMTLKVVVPPSKELIYQETNLLVKYKKTEDGLKNSTITYPKVSQRFIGK